MRIPKELAAFINQTESPNEIFNSIRTSSGIEFLVFSFWSIEEIDSSLEMREEWDVASNLVPFYGDWHNLFCLKLDSTPMVIFEIDDGRNVRNTWHSISDFQKSLLWQDEEPANISGIIESESWLDL
jgi:hypothetical protein